MTNNMKSFIEHNSKCKIIEGRMVNAQMRDLCSASDAYYGTVYTFNDGLGLLLTKEDIKSCDYMPIWDL